MRLGVGLPAVFSGEHVALDLVGVGLVDQHRLQDGSQVLALVHLALLLLLQI